MVLKPSSIGPPKCRGECGAEHGEHEHGPALPLPCSAVLGKSLDLLFLGFLVFKDVQT